MKLLIRKKHLLKLLGIAPISGAGFLIYKQQESSRISSLISKGKSSYSSIITNSNASDSTMSKQKEYDLNDNLLDFYNDSAWESSAGVSMMRKYMKGIDLRYLKEACYGYDWTKMGSNNDLVVQGKKINHTLIGFACGVKKGF